MEAEKEGDALELRESDQNRDREGRRGTETERERVS